MKLARPSLLGVALGILAALFLVGADSTHAKSKKKSQSDSVLAKSKKKSKKKAKTPKSYDVSVARTTFGIPHVRAKDWGSLGYGSGYAFASDNICVLARELVVANGQQSRYFGPGGGRLNSDLFYTFWSSDEVVKRFIAANDEDVQELIRGYAAGYSRYLRDTGKGALPEDCRGAEWVREIDIVDMFRLFHKLTTRAGAPNLLNQIVDAVPPPPATAMAPAGPPSARRLAAATPEQLREVFSPFQWEPEKIGSNMYALGRDVTRNRRGMVLVNPHFPWTGPLRFWQLHVTIPGVIDSMGAAISGSPVPNIAFNRDVAWSHTVSAASRFVLHQLLPVASDPTSYLVDGEVRQMVPHPVTVEVLENDGTIGTREHTFYDTEFGPILAIAPFFPWQPTFALAINDANRRNFRILKQYQRMNQARSVKELARALEEEVALPWVNTAAADRYGNAYYADIGAVPNASNERLEECETPVSMVIESAGLFLLDGARSECQLGTDPDAPQPRIFGAGNLPSLMRTDYVQNSNDSYWLSNPEQRLEGFSVVLGGEKEQQGLRTRLGIIQARERLAGSDGLPGNRFSVMALQAILFGNRNLSAEMMLDDVLVLCAEEPNPVEVDGDAVDVSEACGLLASWDRGMDLDDVGASIWREVWPRMDDIPGLYAVPFDEADPVNTPRGVDLANPAVRSAVMQALARAVVFIADAGLPLDAAWGDVHFDTRRDGEIIPIHGGPGGHGVYNAIGTGFRSGEGYTPIGGGSSIVMGITFDRWGPVARGVLSYSQSSDPESPHFSDQTRFFSKEGWQDLPFSRRQIRKDPNFSEIRLKERRR